MAGEGVVRLEASEEYLSNVSNRKIISKMLELNYSLNSDFSEAFFETKQNSRGHLFKGVLQIYLCDVNHQCVSVPSTPN